MPTYTRKDITFTKGDGVWLWDQNNNKYLDALSGIAVCGLGHAHPQVAATLCKQASTLLHTSNIYRIEAQEQLGKLYVKSVKWIARFFVTLVLKQTKQQLN